MVNSARIALAVGLIALPLVAWWHTEIIYPVRTGTASALSSGWVRVPAGRPATAFWHALKYGEIAITIAAAVYVLTHD